MTASTIAMEEEAVEPSAIDRLTDQAIKNEISKLRRMIASREKDKSELEHEIVQLKARCEELIEAQIARLRKEIKELAPQEANDVKG